MAEFVKVCEDENEERIELPCEDDGTLLLSTLTAQFPGACGLKYRNMSTGTTRGVRLSDGKFHAPTSVGWPEEEIFYCVFPKENKRKSEDLLENMSSKTKRKTVENRKCTDLIVLGLPYKTTEDQLREFFNQFGDIIMCQIKTNLDSGKSKGFGFIRFAKYESQLKALASRHNIDGRWCEVKIPASKQDGQADVCRKVFVGRLTKDITEDDLQEYFSQYGEVLNITVPKPFRGFAFVSFLDPDVANALCGEDHIIKNVSVHLSNAIPKQETQRGPFGRGPGRYENNSWGNRGSSSNSSWSGSSSENRNWGYGGGSSSNNRSNDIPNMAPLGSSLGINPTSGNNNPNHMGGGTGTGSSNNNQNPNVNISLTPALVAAALNQAGWGLLSNLQNNQAQPPSNMGNNQSMIEGGMSTPQSNYGGSQSGGSGGGGWMKNYGMSP